LVDEFRAVVTDGTRLHIMNNTQTVAGGRALLRSAAVALAAGLFFTASPSMALTEVLPGQMPDLAPIALADDSHELPGQLGIQVAHLAGVTDVERSKLELGGGPVPQTSAMGKSAMTRAFCAGVTEVEDPGGQFFGRLVGQFGQGLGGANPDPV
jgi:hypothetical protein